VRPFGQSGNNFRNNFRSAGRLTNRGAGTETSDSDIKDAAVGELQSLNIDAQSGKIVLPGVTKDEFKKFPDFKCIGT
jgi:hypothetical protein